MLKDSGRNHLKFVIAVATPCAVQAADRDDCLVEVSLQDFYYLRAENVVTAQKAAYV